MLATMCPYIVFACLPVILTFWIVTELLSFILQYFGHFLSERG
jgi:uncharacterized membrane protein